MLKRALTGFLALAVSLACLFVAPVPAAAVLGLRDYEDATAILNHYGLVQGDERGYRFMDPISRAEMAKVVVYSLGLGEEAEQLRGRNDFPDVPRGSWYEGVVSMARQVGLMQGDDRGRFNPQSNITYAEVLTVLSRLVGLEPSREPWPATYLRPAQTAGVIPPGTDFSHRLRDQATRGDVFVLLKRTLIDVKNTEGQNLAQRYLDLTPPVIKIDAHPAETSNFKLSLSGYALDAAQLTINGQAVNTTGGFFRTDVDLRMGANTITVQATDYAGNTSTQTVLVTRVVGNIATIQLTGPTEVVAGQTAQFTLTLRDHNNAILTDASAVTAEVTGVPGQFDVRTGRFTAGREAGTATIWLTSGAAAQTSASITVMPGPLSRIAIEPAEVGLAAGEKMVFQVLGYDATNNVVPVTDVVWSATAGVINSKGEYEAPAVNNGAIVTARVGARTAQARVLQANYHVNRVVMSPVTPGTSTISMRANNISTARFEVRLLDSAGMLVTDYKGTLTVTTSDSAIASVPATVTVTDGIAEITVRAGNKAGTATITTRTNTGRVATQNVTTTAQQLQSVRLEGHHQSNANGQWLGVVEAVALDQDGNPMVSSLRQGLVVTATMSPDAAAVFVHPPTATNPNQATIALSGLDAQTGQVRGRAPISYNPGFGTIYITGTIQPQSMNYVQVLPGSLASGQSGTASRAEIEAIDDTVAGAVRSVYVNILDSNGFRVTQPAPLAGLNVELRDNNGVVWPGVHEGQGRFRFDVRQQQAGNYTYTATLTPSGVTHVRTARVVPSGIAQVVLTASPQNVRADNRTQIRLTAELRDAQGNRVVTGTHQVIFRRTTNTGAVQGPTEQAVASALGLATLTVTAGQVIGPETFMVSVVPDPNNPAQQVTASTTISTTGAPQRLRLTYGDNDGDGVAGGPGDHIGQVNRPLTVVVEVLDDRPSPNVVASDNGRGITLTVRGPGNTTQAYTGVTANGRVTFQVQRPTSGTYSVRADASGLISALSIGYGGTAVDMVLQPSHIAQLRVVPDLTQLQVPTAPNTGQSYARVVVQLVDAEGNLTTNQTGAPLMVTLTNTTANNNVGFFTANDTFADPVKTPSRTVMIPQGASSSAAVTFFAGSTAGSSQIQAQTLDGRTHSVTITTTSLGNPHALNVAFDPVSVGNSSAWVGAVGVTTVQVRAVDSSNRRLTGYTGNITISIPAGMRVVGAWNQASDTWSTLNVVGPNTYSIAADRGQAQFRVIPDAGGVKEISVSSGAMPVVTRLLDYIGQIPATLVSETAKPRITAAERQLMTIRVNTAANEPIFTLGSPITFTITAGLGQLSTSPTGEGMGGTVTAPLVSGQALVYYIPPAGVGVQSHNVTVTASVAGLTTPITFVVDDVMPQVTGVTINGDMDGMVEANESIALTFDEALLGSSVLAGLTPGGAITTGLNAARVEFAQATGRINFVGFPLGFIELSPNAIATGGTYAVSEVRLSADGRTVTVILGAPVGAAAVVTAPPTALGVTPSSAIKDEAGNGARSAPNVPVNGQF